MESAPGHFKTLNRDIIVNIMSRLNGCTLAATASTCTDLRDAAKDEIIWKKLCHETWPSTSMKQLPFRGDLKSLYTHAFPLILFNEAATQFPKQTTTLDTSSSARDLTSLIDIYFKGRCIFSKTVEGITEGTGNDNFDWFLYYPFKLDLFGIGCPKVSTQDFSDITNLHLDAFTGYEEQDDLCNQIAQDIRLSWILLDKRKGKAVNISSWKPQSIHRSHDDYTICFGCIIRPVEDSRIAHMLAECVITAKCKLMSKQGSIRWNEITLVIKDMDGSQSHLNGKQSMRVMNRALICSRSVNHCLVEMEYQQFRKQKIELKLRNEKEESIANILSALHPSSAFVILGPHSCSTSGSYI